MKLVNCKADLLRNIILEKQRTQIRSAARPLCRPVPQLSPQFSPGENPQSSGKARGKGLSLSDLETTRRKQPSMRLSNKVYLNEGRQTGCARVLNF
jgi:hypothetical protein